jgi:hypothetical protein
MIDRLFLGVKKVGGKPPIFFCRKCQGIATKLPGDQNKDDKPHVLFCRQCTSKLGEWDTEKERDVELGAFAETFKE